MPNIVTANEDSRCTLTKLKRRKCKMEEEGNSTMEATKPSPDLKCRIYATVVTVTAILALAGAIHHNSAEITAIFQPLIGDCDCESPAVGQDEEGNNFTLPNSRVIPECCTEYCSWFRCVDLDRCGHFPECPKKEEGDQTESADDEENPSTGSPAKHGKDDDDHPHKTKKGNRKDQKRKARNEAQKLKQKKEEEERKARKEAKRRTSEILKEAYREHYQGFVPMIW